MEKIKRWWNVDHWKKTCLNLLAIKNEKTRLIKYLIIGGSMGLALGLFVTFAIIPIFLRYQSILIESVFLWYFYWVLSIPYLLGALIGGYIFRCFETTCYPLHITLGNIIWSLIGIGIAYWRYKKRK